MKETLKQSLSNSPVQKEIRGYIKKFADDLGIKVSEIPSTIGKDLGKRILQNTRFGKQLTSTLQGVQDRFLKSILDGAKRGVSDYSRHVNPNSNDPVGDTYRQATERYRADHSRPSEEPNRSQSYADVPRNSDASAAPDTAITLLSQINESVFAILNSLDSDAANKVKQSREPQQQGKGRPEPHEGGPRDRRQGQRPRPPEESNLQREGNQYDPELDIANKVKDKAKGLYDKLPDSVKNTVGKYSGKLGDLGAKLSSKLGINTKVTSLLGSLGGSASGGAAAAGSTALTTTAGSTASGLAGSGIAGAAAGTAAKAIPQVAIAWLAIKVVSAKLKELGAAVTPAIEGLKKFKEEAKKTFNRFYESQHEMLKEEQKRIQADVETMAKLPFEIMNDAAQKWYDAWDTNLRTIGQTQGYNKADVQTLFNSFAERLRSEGLSSVIGASDIATNLASVLSAGLSGKVAEEFAYKATVLNSQIPTQDFFGYASTYGQLVGNAMARGLNESSAIAEANGYLEQFASNLIYAGRNISDGIATGLKDGSQLFADSVNIALASRTGNPNQISAVVTAVAAELSAIAPDLTSEVLQKILGAATGGNSSELVALRSLAGIDAGNTSFIQAMAQNPQQVFAAMFSGLSRMQKMSSDNYMEVAEGLSQTFGISAEALQRIDFAQLSQAISAMQVNQSALSENLGLLQSGQTTPSKEMMRYQQINQMIFDEGLSYVLDNEAAREFQRHMWDQELANEIMEREYSVDLAGSAKEAVQGIFETVHNILKFLNPFSWLGDLANLIATGAEYDAQKADLRAIIEAGKVGQGNANSFRNLTNYNGSSLNSVPSLMEMMGLFSKYSAVHTGLNLFNSLTDVGGSLQLGSQALGSLGAALQNSLTVKQSDVSSKYAWGFVGKSVAKAIANSPMSAGSSYKSVTSSSDAVRQKEADQMNQILSSMDEAVQANKSYDQWKDEVTKQYKITDFSQALSSVGLSESQVQGQFEAKEAQKVSQHNYERELVEDEFWEKAINYFDNSFPQFAASQLEKMDIQIDWQNKIYDEIVLFHTDTNEWWKLWIDTTWKKEWVETTWKKDWISTQWVNSFLNYWTDIFVKFDTYSKSTHNAYKAIDDVKDKDKKKESGDAVLALAKALTDNTAELRDPTIQTNALLAQILIVAEAILQAENTSGGASLQTSLSALGLGLTTSDTSDTSATTEATVTT